MTVPTVPNIQQNLISLGLENKSLDYLTKICEKLLLLQQDVAKAQKLADAWKELSRCCGVEFYDSKGFLYANHGVTDICPLHGQHPKSPGRKRLRLYVGNKPDAVEEVIKAMENWRNWQKAAQEAKRANDQLNYLASSLERPMHIANNGHRWHI